MYEEMLDAILALLPGAIIGALPEANGVALYLGPGAPTDRYLDHAAMAQLELVVNAKNESQRAALAALSAAHATLTGLAPALDDSERPLPLLAGDGWAILDMATSVTPTPIGPEAGGSQYLYGSMLTIKFYARGAI